MADAPMKVAEVRKALSIIRRSWEDQHVNKDARPFYLTTPIAEGHAAQSAEKFSLSFVLLHHSRRLTKSKPDVGRAGERAEAQAFP